MKGLATLVLLASLAQCSQAAIAVITGFGLTTGEQCLPEDWQTIAAFSRRNLLRGQRQLPSEPWWCEYYCQGWAPGHCKIVYEACLVSRRRNMEVDDVAVKIPEGRQPVLRELTDTVECTNAKSAANDAFNNAMSLVSADCVSLIGSPRTMTCMEILEEGEGAYQGSSITGFQLWNATSHSTPTLAFGDFHLGGAFCRSGFEFNIEAETGLEVATVSFALEGTTQPFFYEHTENEAKFFLFGNLGNYTYGRRLNPGSYILTAVPDNDIQKKVQITFAVNDC